MKELNPGLELANNMEPKNYPQDFVHAENPNKPGPTNESAKKINPSRIMDQVLGG